MQSVHEAIAASGARNAALLQAVLSEIAGAPKTDDGDAVTAAEGLIASALGVSRRTVIRAVSALERIGLLQVERRPGLTSLYEVVTPVTPGRAPNCHTSPFVSQLSLIHI